MFLNNDISCNLNEFSWVQSTLNKTCIKSTSLAEISG